MTRGTLLSYPSAILYSLATTDSPEKTHIGKSESGRRGLSKLLLGLLLGLAVGVGLSSFGLIPNPIVTNLSQELDITKQQLEQAQENISELNAFLREPRISIIEVVVGEVDVGLFDLLSRPCFDLDFNPNNRGAKVSVGFTLINSGDSDGFATVEMVARGEVVATNRFFLTDNTRQSQTLFSDNLACNTDRNEVKIRIASVESIPPP